MEQTEQNTLVRVAYARDLRTEHEFLDSENPMGHNAEKRTNCRHNTTTRTELMRQNTSLLTRDPMRPKHVCMNVCMYAV